MPAFHLGPVMGEEAQQELAKNWRRWLAWAALAPDGT